MRIDRRLTLVALLWCFAVSNAEAQRYSAQPEGDTVRLGNSVADVAVTVVPSVGNMAVAMTVKGHEVLRWPYASVREFKARPGLSGIPFLGAMGQSARRAGVLCERHASPIRSGARQHPRRPNSDSWVRDDDRSLAGDPDRVRRIRAWVTSRLDFFRYPEWIRQWPFAHSIEITYRVQDGALEVATTIRNMSAAPMPVAVGFHPYFKLTDSPRDDWTLSVGARTHWTLTPAKVPTGETEPIEQLLPDPATRVSPSTTWMMCSRISCAMRKGRP